MEFKTTFLTDFSIADKFGKEAVRDTYNRAFKEWKDNYEYLTELVIVLNWKIWEHYQHDDALAKLYDELWRKADEYAMENLKGDELGYFIDRTD